MTLFLIRKRLYILICYRYENLECFRLEENSNDSCKYIYLCRVLILDVILNDINRTHVQM